VISETAKPVYLVDAYSDPVVVRIEGRASFLNSACLRDFVNQMLKSGKNRFVIDFLRCTSMDSTFLGVLAGFALELRKSEGLSGVDAAGAPLVCGDRSELENARLVLEAHENLVSADEGNRGKFQDVLVFMKNRVEQG
jgi:hypothetical protein